MLMVQDKARDTFISTWSKGGESGCESSGLSIEMWGKKKSNQKKAC